MLVGLGAWFLYQHHQRRCREQYYRWLDQLPSTLIAFSATQEPFFSNQKAKRLLANYQIDLDELPALLHLSQDIQLPRSVGSWAAVWQQLQTPTAGCQWYVIQKDRRDPVHLSRSPLPDFAGGGWLLTLTGMEEEEVIQRQLLDDQRFIEAVLNNTPDMLHVYDLSLGRNIYLSKQFTDFVGYTDAEVEAMGGLPLSTLVHPEDLPAFTSRRQEWRELEENQIRTTEFRVRHRDGNYRWLRSREMVFRRDPKGKPTQILGITQDITSFREVQERLLHHEHLFRLISENTHDVIGLHDSEGRYTFVTPSAQELLGQSAESLVGHFPQRYIHPEEFELFCQGLERALTHPEEPVHLEYRVRYSDSQYKWMDTTLRAIRDENGSLTGLQSISRNSDERKSHEQHLHKALSRTSTLLRHVRAGVLAEDEEGRIVLLNETFVRMWELPGDEKDYVGASATALIRQAEHRLLADHSPIRQVLEEPPTQHAVRLETHAGRLLEMACIPVQRDNELYGRLWQVRDITDDERTHAELIQAKEAAERSVLAKDQFLSTMSHELRTPLNGVIGITNLLLAEEGLTGKQQARLKTLKFSADNLLALINDILDFNKIEAGHIKLEEIDFDLKAILTGLREQFLPRAEEKSLQLLVHYDKNLPSVLKGDPTRLTQILNNLVGNALKFTPEGSVTVRAALESLQPDEVHIQFSVKDTGIGIPEDRQQQIFERFMQADRSTTRRFGGTGLGLAITKRLIELQNSAIHVNSAPSLGSEFSFSLRFGIGQNLPEERPLSLSQSLEGIRVLLVEDNEVNQLVAGDMLRNWGVSFDIAPNGAVAVERAHATSYDLILMDLQMEVMDGWQATSLIRNSADQRVAKTPIVALTAATPSELTERTQTYGFTDLIGKPFQPKELHRVIRRHSRNRAYQLAMQPELPLSYPSSTRPAILDMAIPDRFPRLEATAQEESYRQQLTEMICRSLREFADEYAAALRHEDMKALRSAIHKQKTTLHLIDDAGLQHLVAQGPQLLESSHKRHDIAAHIAQIQARTAALAESLSRRIKVLV
ncbi:PAS domain S-box-containing protein [Catalinimonas alkaloidigena]|uniref:histidine kinase n=1 Tax=Catalinimonas alkaloidigena TaxID=1075417 RepID=A0A1G9NXC2_9BACT|nr:PAS domain S-box-containing protein [Catalinimonas alkaloidigena]